MATGAPHLVSQEQAAAVRLGLNRGLLQSLAVLAASRGQAFLTIREGLQTRSLWIRRGALIGTRSTLVTEQLESLLLASDRLDPSRLEVLRRDAALHRRPLSDQLVMAQVLTPTQVHEVLEHQRRLVFERSLMMAGCIRMDTDLPTTIRLPSQPIAQLLIELFRWRLPLAAVESLVGGLIQAPCWMWIDPAFLEGVALLPWEAQLVNRFREPFDLHELARAGAEPGTVTRFLGSLIALRAITFETEKGRAQSTARSKVVHSKAIALGR